MPDQPLIAIDSLGKDYGPHRVLDGVSLDVMPGETVALIGPSGGGKSTLLRCINALVGFERGTLRVGEHRLSAATVANGAAVRSLRRDVGMIFQDFQLFPHLTALGNVVEAPRRVLGLSATEAAARAMELLAQVGLAERASAWPDQLSGGQKQRVAIARALAMQPQALLCDEITSALDPELKHEVLDVLGQLRSQGMTLVVVTHEIGFARRAADRVVVLADAQVVEVGTPSEVLDEPQHPRTRKFLENVLA